MKPLRQLIIENRIAWLRQNARVDTSHDPEGYHTSSADVVDHFARNSDPTDRKIYTNWIINRYNSGDFKQKDHQRVRSALEKFHANKDRVEKRDVNSYKSLAELESVTPTRQTKGDVKREGSDVVHQTPELTVRHLKTREAACRYGAGTKWCTAFTDPERNEFEDYDAKGPLYFVHHPPTNKRYLVHLDTPLIHDENRREYTPQQLVDRHPDLKGVEALSSHPYHGHAFKTDKSEIGRDLERVLTDKKSPVGHKLMNTHHDQVDSELLGRSIRAHQPHPTNYVYLYHLLLQRPKALTDENIKKIRDYPYRHETNHEKLRGEANRILRRRD